MKKALLIFLVIGLLISCKSSISLHASADKTANPDTKRRQSNPVSIQVYQLKDDAKFKDADFFQLTDAPEKVLGTDFIAPMTNFMISPAENLEISVDMNSDAKYLGIIAAFQFIDHSKWKSIIPIDGESHFEIKIKGQTILVNGK